MCLEEIYSDEALAAMRPEDLLHVVLDGLETVEQIEKMKVSFTVFEGGEFSQNCFYYQRPESS